MHCLLIFFNAYSKWRNKVSIFFFTIEHEINNLKVINFDIASKIREDKFRLSRFKVIL